MFFLLQQFSCGFSGYCGTEDVVLLRCLVASLWYTKDLPGRAGARFPAHAPAQERRPGDRLDGRPQEEQKHDQHLRRGQQQGEPAGREGGAGIHDVC